MPDINCKNTRNFSSHQEKSVAKKFSGKQTSNSGATAFNKGDVTFDNLLLECKTATTEKQSMSIKKEWLEKLHEEAFAMGKPYYAVCFNFGTDNPSWVPENYYIINERIFKQFMEFINSVESEK